VFVVDEEVTSGLRYGFPGAMATRNRADLVVYAKAMSNGYPFGTVIDAEHDATGDRQLHLVQLLDRWRGPGRRARGSRQGPPPRRV
jgi:4-aminobutyrate aminotransferase-like enzyme